VSALPLNAFIGKSEKPTDAGLGKVLGPMKPVWDSLIAELASQHQVAIQEWKCYSLKSGWSLRLMRGKRTILWMAPCSGCFRVAFILGDKAILAARQGGLSARLLRMLDEAEKYPEGTGIRLHVRGTRDLANVVKLAEIKLRN
jgi:hypothetical protein